jgi:hypothetical protein
VVGPWGWGLDPHDDFAGSCETERLPCDCFDGRRIVPQRARVDGKQRILRSKGGDLRLKRRGVVA